MARKSTVKRQPSEVREAIGQWHQAGRTLDEILDELEAAYGVTLSRSALHRHVKGLDKVLERLERSRQIAEAAVRRFGQEPESKTVRANIELMHAAISEIMAAADDPKTGMAVSKPMDAMLLAKALEHLTKASRHDAEHRGKIRAAAQSGEPADGASSGTSVLEIRFVEAGAGKTEGLDSRLRGNDGEG